MKEISTCSFAWCTNLESIKMPKSMEMVHYYSFHDCLKLKDAYISSSTQVHNKAFNEAPTTIHTYTKKEKTL